VALLVLLDGVAELATLSASSLERGLLRLYCVE
jgi:hypothetical protein